MDRRDAGRAAVAAAHPGSRSGRRNAAREVARSAGGRHDYDSTRTAGIRSAVLSAWHGLRLGRNEHYPKRAWRGASLRRGRDFDHMTDSQQLSAVVFDLDGLIVNSEDVYEQADV